MTNIYELYEKKLNPQSLNYEYHFKKIVIVEHSLNRFYERIGIKPEILLALVIIHYGDILANIMENRQKLENGDFIEIPIIHEDLRFKIVVRKDKYSDKFVIKTVKYWNFLDYKLQKLRRLSYVI